MEKHNYEFDIEMINEISEEFDSQMFVDRLEVSSSDEIEQKEDSFTEYGKNLIKKSIELGEENKDRTYELLMKAAEKTGELKFPLFPERYIELAYLSIQPFKRLWINSNSPEVFSYKIENCSLYNAIENNCGKDASEKMICQETCFAILEEAFRYFDFDIKSVMESNMAEDESCVFKVERSDG